MRSLQSFPRRCSAERREERSSKIMLDVVQEQLPGFPVLEQ